ncbi:histone deacetylase family protein [Aquihabitans sp. McL0605]|uniref:histone deacetylase family protein n=1 Tax=Aquihabitans sp. McL0605 TaxID=3415671 RepID=UPI003CE926DD
MPVLYATHPRFLDHDTGRGHPESPARLRAVQLGVQQAGLAEALVRIEPVAASDADLQRIHPEAYRRALQSFCEAGGGAIDADTVAVEASWSAALLAAGAGLEVIRRLQQGEGDAGFCAVRPPGHHALASQAMGFCLFNNVAVAAAHLRDQGERVAIVDYDAHHGNGTQDLFWNDPDVFYVSMHEWPQYPGTGGISEVGAAAGLGTTLNLPFPSHTTGDVYRRSLDDVVLPALTAWKPTWLLISAGFDAHRADPITDLGLTSGDYADLTTALLPLVPAGRRLLFLEGGYDLDALLHCTGAVLSALVDDGAYRPEGATGGGPGDEVCDAALKIRGALADGYLRSP